MPPGHHILQDLRHAELLVVPHVDQQLFRRLERHRREPGDKISQYTEGKGLPQGTAQEGP